MTDSGNHRIQKFSPDGEFLSSYGRKGQGPGEFQIMGGVAVDAKKRIWVLSYDRQLVFEEHPVTIHFTDEGGDLEAAYTLKTSDSTQTDAFVFHVFEKNGEFMGKIPLTHFADKVMMFGDRLYILEKDNEMCVFAYRIVDHS